MPLLRPGLYCRERCLFAWQEGAFSSSGDLIRHGKHRASGLATLLGTAAESIFATLFPGNCRFCESPLIRVTRVPVCDACLDAIRALPGDQQVCSVCGERLLRPADKAELLTGGTKCQACLAHQPTFDKAGYYGAYDGGLRELIHLLKYERVRPAADLLGRMVGDVIHDMHPKFGPEPPLVVPVPLHESKLHARGFNQSELIARAALKSVALNGVVNTTALGRIRDTGSQTGLTRHQRQENMRGAFAVVRPDQVAGRGILLIDDVFTTGTTVSECARVLKKARAAHVYVVTVARVLLPDHRGIDPVLEATFAAEASSKPMTRAAHA